MKRSFVRLAALLLCLILLTGVLPSAVFAADVARPAVVEVGMSVGADFGIHFYVHAPEGVSEVGAYIGDVRVRGQKQESGLYRVSYRHLTPKQMTEILTAEPYYVKSGHEIRGTACDFSVCDYATSLLAANPSPELRALLVAMLNYGTAAQRHFLHNLGNFANRNLSSDERSYTARAYESHLFALDGEPTQDTAEISGATLLVQNRVRFKIFVDVVGQEELRYNKGADPDEVVNGMTPEEEAAVLVEGYYVEISPNADFSDAIQYPLVKCSGNAGYRALTDGLYATEYSDAFYFRVVTPEGIGTAISYSVETYAARQNAPNTTQGRLMAAMILFGDAACAYEASLAANLPTEE